MAEISSKRQRALQSAAEELGLSVEDLLNLEKAPDAVKENKAALEEWSKLKEAKRAWHEEAQIAAGKELAEKPELTLETPKPVISPERAAAESKFGQLQSQAQQELKAAEQASIKKAAQTGATVLPAAIETAEQGVAKGAAKEFGKEVAQDLAKSTKGLSAGSKALIGLGAAGLAGAGAYLAGRDKKEQPAATPASTAAPATTVRQAISTAIAPTTEQNADKKADEILTRSKDFSQRRQEYLEVTPSGALSEKEVEKINSKYESEKNDIEQKLVEAKEEFQAGRNRLQNAELIDTLGKGLVQLMAGIYGLNTGVDAVTGVDFRPKDWSSNFSALQSQYRQQYNEIKDLRSELESRRKEDIRLTEQAREKEAARVGRAGQLALGEMKEEAALAGKQKKAEEKQISEREKLITKARAALGALRESKNKKDRQAQEQKVSAAFEAAGIPSEEISKALKSYEPGSIFTKENYSPLEALIAQPETVQPKTVTGPVDMVAPDGRKLKVPADKVQEMERLGAKRI